MINPKTEAELATAIQDSAGPLRIRGGGTRDYGRPVQGEVLSTAALSGITLYEPGALTIVAQAGTPVEDIKAELAEHNQQLAFEPTDHRDLLGTSGTPTIGGVVAANVSGPRRIAVGATRDFLLGVRFVDGQGTVIKNGGRVMKNVTGYDLVKLMAGSYGTLGVITEVSLKVLPAPEAAATVVLDGLTAELAVKAMSHALGSPFDVNGAAYDGESRRTFIRLEGFRESVTYRSNELRKHLVEFGDASVLTGEDHSAVWNAQRDVTSLSKAKGDIWRISTRPSQAAKLIENIQPPTYSMDWGGGLIWLETPKGTDIRSHMTEDAGHATLMKASAETRANIAPFHPEPEPLAQISEGLRRKFDPRRILNPGLML